MTHTPEPWQSGGLGYVESAGKVPVARAMPHDPARDANARRIVACVNALAGMNPEALADVLAAAGDVAASKPHMTKRLIAVAALSNALDRLRGDA